MSAAHTPGPWVVGTKFSDGKQPVTPIYASDPPCPACNKGAGKWLVAWLHENAVGAKQRKANARLIAAAPLMLAELRKALAAVDVCRHEERAGIRAAIKAATGEGA